MQMHLQESGQGKAGQGGRQPREVSKPKGMHSIGHVSAVGTMLCSHSWRAKESPEKTERTKRKIRDALSKVFSRKHAAMAQNFLPPAKIHRCASILEGACTELWVFAIIPSCPILLPQLCAWVCRVACRIQSLPKWPKELCNQALL